MSIEIKTHNIFIDTSIFVEANFQFESPIFEKLVELVQEKKTAIYLTEITVDEIKANIRSEIQTADAALNSFKSKGKILRNVASFKHFFDPLNHYEIEREILRQFEIFRHKAKIEVISSDKTSIMRVFADYFNRRPPFGVGKKKSEFPDAFALAALEERCSRVEESMYVISSDNGMLEASRVSAVLHPLSKIEKYLHIYNYCSDPQSSFLTELIDNNTDAIEKEIESQFTSLGFILVDGDGDIDDVEVNDIEITEQYIIDIEESRAVLHLQTTIHYSVDLSYWNYDTAIYDSSEGDVFPIDKITDKPEFSEDVPIELTIQFKKDDPSYFVIESLTLRCGDIEVYVADNSYD